MAKAASTKQTPTINVPSTTPVADVAESPQAEAPKASENRGIRMTDEQVETILIMGRQRTPNTRIAAEVGTTPATVGKILAKHGISKRGGSAVTTTPVAPVMSDVQRRLLNLGVACARGLQLDQAEVLALRAIIEEKAKEVDKRLEEARQKEMEHALADI